MLTNKSVYSVLLTILALGIYLFAFPNYAQAQETEDAKPQYRFFKATNGIQMIAYKEEGYSEEEYISTDGKTFKMLDFLSHEFDDEKKESVDTFENPRNGKDVIFYISEDAQTIRVGKTIFKPFKGEPSKFKFLGYPEARYVVGLLKLEKNKYLFITDDANSKNRAKTRRLFLGPLHNMKALEITDSLYFMCNCYKITTVSGGLHYEDGQYWWDGTEVTSVDLDKYRFLKDTKEKAIVKIK